MTVTLAAARTVLDERLGALRGEAGVDDSAAEHFAWATRQLGYVIADIAVITDDELSVIADDEIDRFLLWSEYRLLRNIQGNLALVDVTAGPRGEKLSQLATQVAKMLETVEGELAVAIPVEAGYVTLSFAEHNEGVV